MKIKNSPVMDSCKIVGLLPSANFSAICGKITADVIPTNMKIPNANHKVAAIGILILGCMFMIFIGFKRY